MRAPAAPSQATRISALWSGVALALALALSAKLAASALNASMAGTLNVSPVALAVFTGIALRNTVGVNASFDPGLQWVTLRVLRVGIALVGLRLTLDGFGSAGMVALPVTLICITAALAVSLIVGRMLGLTRECSALLALGTSVCGCTAVVAASPVLRARPADTGVALTCVVVLGSLGMLMYPWLAAAVFHGNAKATGVFLGTAIHDTSQVVGAALIHAQQFGAPEVVPIASFTKLLRNLSMLFLIPLMALWVRADRREVDAATASVTRAHVLPGFLAAFVCFAVMRTVGDQLFRDTEAMPLWHQSITLALASSDLLLVCGMVAVGLSVSLRELRHAGWRGLATALTVALAVAAGSLATTLMLQQHLLP